MTALKGGKLELHGGGLSVRSFIHIDDVSEGTVLAAQHGENGSCYHISNNHEISIRSLVAMILNELEVNFDSSVKIVNERLGKDQSYLLTSNRLRKLGWTDRTSLEDGLRQTIHWARKHLDALIIAPQSYIHKP